jgi:large subunit ribosomal protein L3
MAIGLLGKKLGMTHIYDDFGRQMAVTAVQAGPCTVVGLRTPKQNGYQAVQLGFEPVAEGQLIKPRAGQFKKAGTGPFRYVREFRVPGGNGEQAAKELAVGQQLTVELFKRYELIDVTGISIGKGFQGGIKRWKWSGGPQTHGSMSHRAPGSIGSSTTPGRVFRGHHLPGHMGSDRVTVQNVRIVQVDPEANLLFLEGAVPGPEHGLVMIRKSKKLPDVIKAPQAIVEVVEEEDEGGKKAKTAAKKG